MLPGRRRGATDDPGGTGKRSAVGISEEGAEEVGIEELHDSLLSQMGEKLGSVHPESYVLVHEVPAAAYGYGGVTQEHRYIAGRLAAA